jgi:hypothetical protein
LPVTSVDVVVTNLGRLSIPLVFGALAAVACSSGGGVAQDAGVKGGGGGSATGGRGSSETGGGGTSATGGSGGSADAGSAGANAGSGGAYAGTGGTAGASAGTGGTAGVGAGGAAGTGGRPRGTCTFEVNHMPSPMVGTVEVVTFSLDEADLTDARIDFGPSDAAPTMTAPVDLRAPLHRTLLLGLKGQRPYTFRIVATTAAKTCTSPDFSFTTGVLPAGAPKIAKTAPGAGGAKGFIVTTTGVDAGASSGQPDAYIFDTDGDVVWWTYAGLYTASANISRAHMSWDAKTIWLITAMSGRILSLSMDGLAMTDYSSVVRRVHHDFTPLPDGGIATMVRGSGTEGDSIVELKPDGTITTVVADLSALYGTGSYPNAIHYYAADDSYTLGDRTDSLFVKFKRSGTLVWQLGGSNPRGRSFALVGLAPWTENHGHHLTPDGRFVFFNNHGTSGSSSAPAVVWELLLDETAGTATKTWEYHFGGAIALALGDAERLPNGNILVTHSMGGLIHEVDRLGNVVQSFRNSSFGYVDFRTSLYGPPPR